MSSAILTENARRADEKRRRHDPITGEGCVGDRFSLALKGVPKGHPETLFLPDAALTRETLRIAERAFVQRIPEMLLQPTSVSELGVSISRAGADALRAYYRAKCRELGLENLLDASERPRVTIY